MIYGIRRQGADLARIERLLESHRREPLGSFLSDLELDTYGHPLFFRALGE